MKKIMTLLLSVVMVISIMGGCAKNTTDEKDANQTTKETAKETKKETKKQDTKGDKGLYTEKGTYPITNEKIELNFLTLNVPFIVDFETNEFVTYMEEKTNIHINWEFAPSDKKEEKLNLVLASGTYPDVFYGMSIKPNFESQYGVDQQIFLPLNDLIEEHGINFKNNVFNKFDWVKGRLSCVDGNIYALPTWNDCYHCNHALKYWINTEWLQKLNLDMPTTTEEFYQVLKAFKEKDPNGNNKADEIPLTGSNTWHGFLEPFLINSFILDPDDNDSELRAIVTDGTVKTIADTEEYREGLRYIRRLYKEGLIAEGSFTQKSDQLKQIATNPEAEVVGVIPGGFAGLIIDSTSNPERYAHYDALAPLEGPTGLRQTTKFNSALQTGEFIISSTCKYPEAAMRWADYLYTTEGANYRAGTREGRDFAKAEPGDIGIDGKPAKTKVLIPYSQELQNKGFIWLGPEYCPAEDRLGVAVKPGLSKFAPEGLEILLYQATAEKYEPYVSKEAKRLPPVKLSADENDQIQIIKVELEKYMKESRLKFLLGNWSLDDDWDQYVKGLKSIGIDEYFKVIQKAYDRQYK